ncbi:flagellar assembly protein FliW [Brevibacillus sp. H7]|uniref:flagellar assembly protein FliW n=1 Tax=Brevibacillus sp. H7 TaxID=3349138 RepID=UPI0038059C92
MAHVQEMTKLFFEDGIPGFPHLQFFQLQQQEANSPFFLLTSIEDPNVEFGVIDPFSFFPDYEFTLNEQVKESLKITEEAAIAVLNIVTLRSDGEVTVNLKAPLVMNMENRMAKQVILTEENYQVRQPLFHLRSKAASE